MLDIKNEILTFKIIYLILEIEWAGYDVTLINILVNPTNCLPPTYNDPNTI